MKARTVFATVWTLGLLMAVGCAPLDFKGGAPWMVKHFRTTDARTQTVRDMPFLRLDSFQLDALDEAGRVEDAERAWDLLKSVIDRSHRVALHSIHNEIDRLPPEAFGLTWRLYFPNEAKPAEPRPTFRQRYLTIVEAAWKEFLPRLEDARTRSNLTQLIRTIRGRVNPSIKDSHGQGLFLANMMANLPESQDPLDRGGPNVDVYEPRTESLAGFVGGAGDASSRELELLAQFAPIIIQEKTAAKRYRAEADLIGTVRLEGTHDHIDVAIDTRSPSVYCYAQPTIIHGRQHIQLIYCHWFPERPPLKSNDAEAGHIDGATFRITLDAENRPAIFETILNCGCYHRCYVSAPLEAAIREEFGPPLEGRHCSAARAIKGAPDWVVPETVEVPVEGSMRPIIFSRAGYHGLAAVSFDRAEIVKRSVQAARSYELQSYDVLERLPTAYGHGSMFGADGLVHYAGRREGWLLAGTGMISAGQPRQRGTQRICWDQYDFDDPHLLDKCLRLPADF